MVVLVGPTAGGKTRLGVEAAHLLRSEIVSADSRQVYRGLDIGSGKDLHEYARVRPAIPYHLIDVADPRDVYSVLHYQQDCYRLLEGKQRETSYRSGRPLVMVGGSGLYVEAVLQGYRIPTVPPDEPHRAELMLADPDELVAELRRRDPGLAARTDCSSKKRVVRALEIVRHANGETVERSRPAPVRVEHAVFALDISAGELARRIDARLEHRLDAGMIAEVEGLLATGVPRARMDQLGLEYREVSAYLDGAQSREAMVEALRLGIRRLAKRQRTWFRGLQRRGTGVRWVEPAAAVEAMVSCFAEAGGA